MSLIDDIRSIATNRCEFCTWYAGRSAEEKAEFDAYLDEVAAGRGRYSDLYEVCVPHGLTGPIRSFREHCHNHRHNVSQ